jgi:hypothetical protein
MKRFVSAGVWGVSLLLLCNLAPPARSQAAPPPPRPATVAATEDAQSADESAKQSGSSLPKSRQPQNIQKYLDYYLDMYGKHLKSPDWMARAMGVISLARLDAPQSTEKLMDVMRKDSEALVKVYAWEALHGRHTRLTAAQRAEWVKTAWQLFDKNLIRGEMRVAVVGLIEEGGPTDEGRQRFMRLFETTSSINPVDIRTIEAMGDMLARWKDPVLFQKMLDSMGVIHDAYRAEMILRQIPGAKAIPEAVKLRAESSQDIWSTAYKNWSAWFDKAGWKAIEPNQARPYTALSRIMPAGDRITDVNDSKWKRDLELKKFRLDQLDVGLALDTTASMDSALNWCKQDVVKMMRVFELVSHEPRIGITLYRDHGDKYVTKSFPLTSNAGALATALMAEDCGGGGDVPEAVFEALDEMVNKQRWSNSNKSKKVIVLLSDAPPQQNTLGQIETLVKDAAKRNFVFYTVKVQTYVDFSLKLPNYDKTLATFDRVAEWGGGKSIDVAFWNQTGAGRWLWTTTAIDDARSSRAILRDVLRCVLEDDYKDRVGPFVNVIIEFVEEFQKEQRQPFPKAGPTKSYYGPRENPQEKNRK